SASGARGRATPARRCVLPAGAVLQSAAARSERSLRRGVARRAAGALRGVGASAVGPPVPGVWGARLRGPMFKGLGVLCCGAPCSGSFRKESVMALTLAEANAVMQAAIAKAREMNIKISVAVCDAGGRLMAFNRMDGAIWGSA